MHKRLISLLLAFVLVLGVLPVAASALSASDLPKATTIELDTTYSHTWKNANSYYNNPLHKLTLEEDGVLTVHLARPFDTYGTDYEDVKFRFYAEGDLSSYVAWLDSDNDAHDTDKENCTMQVCLPKGTYYVEVDLDGYFYASTDDMTGRYSFSLDSRKYIEIERNSSKTTASPMELGHMYYGTLLDSDNYDYFSFPVTAGHKYVITFDNFATIDNTTAIMKIELPNGSSVSPLYYAEDNVDANGKNYYIFKVEKSGTAYICLYNCNRPILYGIRMDDAATYHTHNYIPKVTLPTCGKDGYTTYTCACGESYTDDTMPATGLHTYTNEYDDACDRCSAKREAPTDNSNWGDIYTDVGDYASKATYITPRGAAGSLIGDDEDWYKFEVTKKSKIAFWGASEWQYIHYYIYNADRSLYWRDTYWGYNGSHHQRLNTTLEPGTYYIRVFNTEELNYVDLTYTFNYDMTHVHEHSYTSVVNYAPNCIKQGYTVYTCACGDNYTDNVIPANGQHKWTGTDCNQAVTCALCGVSSNGPIGHIYDNGVDGTCNICSIHRETTEQRNVMHMFRMYDPNSGEHFYTGSTVERDNLVAAGWHYEGVGFTFSQTTGSPVYRLYDPVYGEHLYTMDEAEKASLMAAGWNLEGIAFNSAYDTEVPQYRLHNPNAKRGAYHFTASVEERDFLISLGWEYQGIGFYSSWK